MRKLLLAILLFMVCLVIGQTAKAEEYSKNDLCIKNSVNQADSTHFKKYVKLYNDLTKAMKETKDLDEYKAIQAQLMLLTYLIKEEELLLKQ